MTLYLKCDTCAVFDPKPHGMPEGWRLWWDKDRMKHTCPKCAGVEVVKTKPRRARRVKPRERVGGLFDG